MKLFGRSKSDEIRGSDNKGGVSVIAIVQADAEGRIRLWNAGAEALFGHTAAQAVGQTLDLIVPQNFREAHWKGFRRAMDSKGMQGNEPFVLPILCRDGKTKPFAGRLLYLSDAYGTAVGALGMFVPEKTGAGVPDLYRL